MVGPASSSPCRPTPRPSRAPRRYARIIADHSTRRRLIAAGGELSELGYANGDIDQTTDQAEHLVLAVTTGHVDETRSVAVADLLGERLDHYEQLFNNGEPPGLRFGWLDMDRHMPPMRAGQLVVVGARPSVGKTAPSL